MKGTLFGVISVLVALMLNIRSGNCSSQVGSIQSSSITHVDNSESIAHEPRAVHRRRRSVLNSSEMKEALEAHNQWRRQQGASDMELMKWNTYLASMADDWANGCVYKHDKRPRDPNTMPFPLLGQNLYAMPGSSINITRCISDWHSEKSYFNYDTLGCQIGKMCYHYTQVVWSTSREVGCAYAKCANLMQSNLTVAVLLVCNYGPAGNLVNTKPFAKGPQCTTCASGSMWCNQGLCDRGCSAPGPNCKCNPICKKSATVKSGTCSCSCQPGFYGPDCGSVCKDTDSRCNPLPGKTGYPPSWCTSLQFGDMTRKLCPAMCKLC